MKSWIHSLSGDAFGGTLLVLPLVVLGLWWVGRWAGRRGGRPTPPTIAAAEGLALAALLVAIAGRHALGLRYSAVLVDGVLAAGLLLLLGHRVARLLIALRPALGERLPERPPWVFFLLPLLVYVAVLPWSAARHPPDGDEPYYLLMTHSLAYDFDARLSNNYDRGDSLAFMDRRIEPQPGDPVGADGEIYSRHTALLPLALAPAYRAAGRGGALFCMAALAAALAWWTLRLSRRYFPESPGGALGAYSILAFAPPLLFYSYQVWIEVPAALLTVMALDQLNRLRERPPRSGPGPWLTLAGTLVLLPLLKIRFMLLAAPLLALTAWRASRSRRGLLVLAALVGVAGAAILGYNSVVYGNPLRVIEWRSLLGLIDKGPGDYFRGAAGIFLDCAFGLASHAPVWLLLAPAAAIILARHRRFAVDALVLSVAYLAILTSRGEWYGGWGPPFRYGMALLPVLALALVPLLDRSRRGARPALTAGLGALTAALTALTVVVPGWTYHIATGTSDLLELAGGLQGADLARLFPTSVRPRPATWLWPVAVAGAAGLWWWPRRLPRAGAWGVTALLVLCTLFLGAAHGLPTRRIDAEDRHVAKTGGRLEPEEWMRTRVRFESGWLLDVGDRLVAPVVADGDSLRLTLDLRAAAGGFGPPTLALGCGDRQLGLARPELSLEWRRVELGPYPWQPGEPLVLELLPPTGGPAPQIVVDGIDLEWTTSRH